jgi:hypothetical protein
MSFLNNLLSGNSLNELDPNYLQRYVENKENDCLFVGINLS